MAPVPPIPAEIQRLIDASSQARSSLGGEIIRFRHRLDVPARMRDSLRSHPTGWFAGTLAAGLATSMLLRSPRSRTHPTKPSRKRGIPASLLGLGLTLAKPYLKDFLVSKVRSACNTRPSTLPGRHDAPPF